MWQTEFADIEKYIASYEDRAPNALLEECRKITKDLGSI